MERTFAVIFMVVVSLGFANGSEHFASQPSKNLFFAIAAVIALLLIILVFFYLFFRRPKDAWEKKKETN